MEYLCHKWPRICSTCRKHFPVLSSFTTYHGFVTRLTRRVSLVEQELLTLPEHLCYSSFSFMCMLCRSLFFLLYFFFWPLLCLFFFDIQILIYPLVSSNSSSDTMSLYSLSNQSFLKSTINENEEEGNAITHGLSTMNVISTS